MRQKTIARTVEIEGIGLHTGKKMVLKIHPAPQKTGIVFIRSDLKPKLKIPGYFAHVCNTQLATTLGHRRGYISTVEHLLAAVSALGIDNLFLEINGSEIPILDGSAQTFFEVLLRAGTRWQQGFKKYIRIRKKVELNLNEKWAVVMPDSKNMKISASIEWDHPCIGYQEWEYEHSLEAFQKIAAARTFGFLSEAQWLRQQGLAKGGSLENAIVMDAVSVLNPEGLRYEDECVRHKVLDVIGDLALAGVSILGHFRLHRSGHDLHWRLLQKIFENKENYEVVSVPSKRKVSVPKLEQQVVVA